MAKKILLIDDEELLTKSFSKLLEKQGYEVYTVKNGADAIAMVEGEDFDLLISDIRMPGQNGVEVVKEIEKLMEKMGKAKFPVIFVTGFADEKIEEEAKKLKPLAYLMKPFDVSELMKVIKGAI